MINRQNLANVPLYIAFEGGELTGKSSAVKLLVKVLSDSQILEGMEKVLGVSINLISQREPQGRGRDMVLNILGLNGKSEKFKLGSKAIAEIFTHARKQQFGELRQSLKEGSYNVVVSDRSFVSMIALQGNVGGRSDGVELVDLVDRINWAISGLIPDGVFFFSIHENFFAEDISIRQLMAIISGRELMAQDLQSPENLFKLQNNFIQASEILKNELPFFYFDAMDDPIRIVGQELQKVLDILSLRLDLSIESVLQIRNLFETRLEQMDNEGLFSEQRDMASRQELLRVSLARMGLSATELVNRYKNDETGLIDELKNRLTSKGSEGLSILPRNSRK